MRRAKEVQVVFKDCQDKDATEKGRHCRRAMKKEMRKRNTEMEIEMEIETETEREMMMEMMETMGTKTEKGKWKWKRTMTKNAEDGAPAQDGRGVTAG